VNEKTRTVAARIRQELQDLRHIIEKSRRGMKAARLASNDQDLFLDSVALNLHDFYSGVERTLQHIAAAIDNNVPGGSQWHQDLLLQMHTEVAGVRPPVLSDPAIECLKEYLAFRHVVRNVYTFTFDAERVAVLVDRLDVCYDLLAKDLNSFAEYLESPAGA
jgi:hypothetical protein